MKDAADMSVKNDRKREYAKPGLRIIDLAAEEVLASGCKTGSGGAPGIPDCVVGGCVLTYGS